MAISLGSIGNFFSRALDFSSSSSSAAPALAGTPSVGSYDGANFSDEMLDGMQNPLVDSIAQTVQQVQLAQSFGADASTTLQQLQQEYQQAQTEGVSLPPELQQAVEQILGQAGLLPGLGQDGLTPGAGQNFGGEQGMTPGSGEGGGSAATGSGSGGNAPQAAADGGGQAGATQTEAPAAGQGQTWNMTGLFDQALAQEPADFRNPEAWAQGDTAGNCSAVAVIKAATAESGNAIFQNVQKTEVGGYVITTQDGRTVNLSQADLVAAEKTADFEGPDSPAKAQAVVAAGVIAKNYQVEHPGLTYQQALNATNGIQDDKSNPQGVGRYPHEVAHDLGIPYTKTDAPTALQEVRAGKGSQATVIYNNQHAEVVTGNRQGATKVDDYGQSVNSNGQISKNGQKTQATAGIELHSKPKPAPTSTKAA